MKALTKIFGSKNERELKRIWPRISEINKLEATYQPMSDDELRAQTGKFREQLAQGATLDDLLPDAFAVVREAGIRTLNMRHFDVQLLGGMVLHDGKIAEMKTGEGKTLVATLPVYLNALAGNGVHLVTVNDYLAKRDCAWMGKIYNFLGMSTGVVYHGMSQEEKQAAYRADITYGQNNEYGFDYLRDNMKLELGDKAQRGHFFAIVDEVDSILIDEARTPLIISGPAQDSTEAYRLADSIARKLKRDVDYEVELKSKQSSLSEAGVARVEELLQLDNLYDPRNIAIVHHINQAIKAHSTMERDFDYVVRDGQVIIVDEFTGRLMPGRRWSDGLHQAVEAKEGANIQRENQTLATITFQNYFRMYKKLAGMTGTADTEAVEFKKIYNLDVVIMPTNRPMVRRDNVDVVFSKEPAKFRAVCDEIEDCFQRGQPVLVGTASIAKSEQLSALLVKRGIKHHVLNAKQHEREAEIVAQAGRYGAVTISTNMAGRGTDIVLGGNAEFLAASEFEEHDPNDPEYREVLEEYRAQCNEEREKVVAAGGLHVLGTERHESRRIDNQLRGRSGRQGDPGSSRFYVSFEDELMKRFGGEKIQAVMARVGMKEDDAIEGNLVGRAVENAQKKVEAYNFEIRKHLIEYDDVMNKQREVIYSQREKIMHGEEVEAHVLQMIPDIIEDIILVRVDEKEPPAAWDIAGMFTEFRRIFAISSTGEDFVDRKDNATKELAQELFEHVHEEVLTRYEERKKSFGEEDLLKLERLVLLQAIDYFWKEHLTAMDHLKEGIGLRGWGQKNPLHEYQREGFELFASMMAAVRVAVIQNLFIPELPKPETIDELEAREKEELRKQEARAAAIHEDASGGDAPRGKSADLSHLNRKQRRAREQQAARDTKKTRSNVR